VINGDALGYVFEVGLTVNILWSIFNWIYNFILFNFFKRRIDINFIYS
jgi:hypothetical protein